MVKTKNKRFVSMLLAVMMIFAAVPVSVFAAPVSDIPSEMLDNVYLDALAYTGYGVQKQKDAGTIFKKYGGSVESGVLSGITYDYACNGLETNASGKPDIAAFRASGLCCASYVSYVYFNYLPNVAGIDISNVPRPANYRSASGLSAAADSWVTAGLSRRITFTQSADGSNFNPSEEIPIGSLVVFKSIEEGGIAHVALYAGYYNGQYFLTHVGNDRGPEISTIVGMSKGGYPEAVVQIVTPPVISGNGAIEVYKKDPNGKNLSGAYFVATSLKDSSKQYRIGPTNANGYAISQEPIPYGDYRVVETVFPTNYRAYGKTEWNVTVSKDNKGVVTINAVNEEIPGSCQIVKTSEDGEVDGISFRVQGNGIDKTVKTSGGGKITINDLKPGVYTVTEITDDKYEPQESRSATIVSGKTATVTFNNTLKRGDLTVTKTSEDGLNESVKFHLFGTSISGLAVDEYAVTDNSGKAYFRDVLIGTGYTLEEVDTAIRYVVPENQTAAVEWNKVTNKSFTNILKKWNVTVTKSDSESGTPQGDASLAGAVYGIYNGEQLIDTYTTDANGQFTTKFYICGDGWSVREVTPSEGYLLDESAHHIGAEAKNYTVEYNSTANNVTEQIIKGNIALIKHTDDGSTQLETPEVGAEFEVFLKTAGSYAAAKDTERDYLVCDENGFAETKDLPYGIYTVHQVKGWDGRELLPDFDVYIAKNAQTYRYLANNANFESYIKIVKVDAETGKVIPYAGAGFQLYRPDGSLITQTFTYPSPTAIDTFYTNDEGTLITPEKLEYGSGYSLIEVFAPYGYTLNSDPVYFDVVQDASTDDGGVAVIEVVKENIAQKGVIKISKSGEVFSSASAVGGGYIDENGNDIAFPNMYQPVFSVQGLPGAVYEIIAAENIITPDGTLRASAGEIVDTVTTDETGLAESKALYLGKYEIREIKAPYSMVLNTEIRTAELVYAGQEIEITETAASFYNERQKAAVSLDKVLEQNEQFGIGMNSEITAVTFGLFAAEDLTAADGSVIPADGLLEILSVDENGHADCKTDLPFGSFYLKELSTDEHYILSDEKHPIVFEYAGQEIALVEIRANDGKPIDNDLIYGEIHGLKKDEDGIGLGGAVIGLFKADCTEFTTENALMTATSAEDGSFSFADVPYGNWLVREIEAPTAFVLSEETFAVAVDKDGAVIEVEIENTLIRGTVQLTKVDKDYPDNKLTGAEFAVYRDSNGNKELDADDELLGTLTETGIGVYEMPDLIYGGYFVKEQKSPLGFYLDENAYYFEITEHGKTVIVENEAGKGFVNTAQVGSLKIIKTSSDNKVEGFSFRVTGPNGYSEVFTTDKNGEILIENLRIGEYVITEVSDSVSAAYILPADKTASVFEGAVTKVEMHNELRDTPKTGDDSNPALWKWLTAIGVLGFATCGGGYIAYAMKKRRKDGAE